LNCFNDVNLNYWNNCCCW